MGGPLIMLLHSESVLQHLPEAILLLDKDGYFTYLNNKATLLTGYAAHEIIKKPFSILENNVAGAIQCEFELGEAFKKGHFETEGWKQKRDGSRFWCGLAISPISNASPTSSGFCCCLRDLSEKKEYELALRQSEERFRLMVEGVRDYAIFMLDTQGYILTWNDGAKRTKGYSSQEIIGKHFSTFYTSADIEDKKPERELVIAIATGKYEEEGWRVKKNGSVFWANVVITALFNENNKHIGFSKVTRDLTERKESERALRESYDRYRLLAEELRNANAELSYANQELEQFTSIVSHDLQEPIRTIKSFLQLIDLKLESASITELKNYVTKSVNATHRMRELIQNLLQYAQLSRGEMISQTVDVNDLFSQALQNLRTAIEANDAQVHIENEVAFIYGDPIQLVQLVQNLVSNALKFTVSEKPQIRIRCTRENGVVQFSVSDNGIGIAKGDLHKVFEIFKRLSTEKAYPGTGIGLAICKKIVDRHHGRIWPESEPGKGTTFYFTLNEPIQGLQTA